MREVPYLSQLPKLAPLPSVQKSAPAFIQAAMAHLLAGHSFCTRALRETLARYTRDTGGIVVVQKQETRRDVCVYALESGNGSRGEGQPRTCSIHSRIWSLPRHDHPRSHREAFALQMRRPRRLLIGRWGNRSTASPPRYARNTLGAQHSSSALCAIKHRSKYRTQLCI